MGIGTHGGSLEMIRWLAGQGARVVATDIKKRENLELTIEKLKNLKNLEIITGQHRPEDFKQTDLVIKNPAVPWRNKYIQLAVKNNIPIEMDSSLFMQQCKSNKIIGVTGTKGKTTTASLIAEIFQKAGLKVSKAGIGQESVMDKLKEIDKNTFVVFELSSWRLAGLKKIARSPKYAVVTNIYPDHLNHYASMEEYIEDKRQIYLHQSPKDYSVFNLDNDYTQEMSRDAASQKYYFSISEEKKENLISIKSGKVFFKKDGEETEIMDVKEIGLRGSHNIHNALAAIGVALLAGIDREIIKKTVKTFGGVAHRLELAREFNGVYYYNDTTATTPEASMAGINSFLKPIHLIAGGSSKKLNSRNLAKKIANSKYVKKVYLLEGSATDNFKKEIEEFAGEEKVSGVFDNLEEALSRASQNARAGEVVLLSPGFASFGMFENEFDRGRQYKELVKKLQ